ncbi:MAG: WD40 repeat domain-containing serine/threonine-protein kinase [Gemmataceae bacterium]|nr:WD40 repeat domain-containing serine/threonine-protein kinase [Gemmataceae bacterium]
MTDVVNRLERLGGLPPAWTAETPATSAHPGLSTGRDDAPGDAEATSFLQPPRGPGEIGWLGTYRILKVLGQGGMGVVFLAEDSILKRPVALKVMRGALAERATARQRFLREAQAAAAVRHEHVVTIYQAGEQTGVGFLAMELLHGESLEARLQREGRLPIATAVDLGKQIALGLAAAHAHGLIHRDVKPANIWLEQRIEPQRHRGTENAAASSESKTQDVPSPCLGASVVQSLDRVKILDFGLARAGEGEVKLTQSGAVLGTPAYMAPEQAEGKPVDARTDLFSLGCVLYQMVTGDRPFRGDGAMQILRAVALEQPAAPHERDAQCPRGLSELILQLLAKNPAERPVSAAAVAERLERIAGELAAPPLRRPGPRRLWPVAAAVLLALLPLAWFVAPTIIRFATNQGELVVTIEDANARDVVVSIQQNGIQVEDKTAKRQFILTAIPGEIEVYEKASGLKVATKKFTLTRAGRETVVVTLGPPVARAVDKKLAALLIIPSGDPPPSPLDKLDPAKIPAAQRFPWQPRELVAVIGEHRQRHWGDCTALAFSPDGKYAASGGQDSRIVIYDVVTQNQLHVLHRPGEAIHGVHSLAFSPDGLTLAAGYRAIFDRCRQVHLWDLRGTPSIKSSIVDGGGWGAVLFSPTGDLAAWSLNRSPTPPLRLWDVKGNSPKVRVEYPPCRHAAFSPDGKTLACTDENGKAVRLYDAAAAEPKVRGVVSLAEEVSRLAFAPGGRLVVFGKEQWSVWDVDGAKPSALATVKEAAYGGHFTRDGNSMFALDKTLRANAWDLRHLPPRKGKPYVHDPSHYYLLAVSPDGTTLMTVQRGAAHFWDAVSGEEKKPLAVAAWPESVRVAPDGDTVAFVTVEEILRVWDLREAAPRELKLHEQWGQWQWPIAFLPRELALWTGRGTMTRWDRTDQRLVPGPPHELKLWFNNSAADGNLLAAGLASGQVALFDISGKAPVKLHVADGHKGAVGYLALAPGTLATAEDAGKEVILWRIADNKLVERARIRQEGVYGLALTPDGMTLAIRDPAGNVALYSWNGERLKGLVMQYRSGGGADSMSFAPGGRVLATVVNSDSASAYRDVVVLVDVATGQPLRRWVFPGLVAGVRFAPDGRHLFTFNGNGTIYVLRLTEDPGTLVRRSGRVPGLARWDVTLQPKDGQAPPKPVAVTVGASPDGKTLATGTNDGRAALWDLTAATAPLTLKHHRGAVQAPVWSPDAKRLATASSADRTLAMWSSVGELLWTLGDYDFDAGAPLDGFFFSGDGRLLLAAHGGQKVARLVDAVTGRVAQRLPARWGVGIWSADSRRIFTFPTKEEDSLATTWEQTPDGGDWVAKGTADPFAAPHQWSRDRRRSASYHNLLLALDPDGRKLATLPHGATILARPRWSLDDSRLAVDDTVYDTATWKQVCKIPFEPNSLAWAAGGRLVAGSDRGRVQAFDSASGDPVGGVLQFYEGDAWLLVGADGHYRCSPRLDKHLVYMTRTADGKEERLSPAEFATKYGWKNDPAQARILVEQR